MTYKRNVLISYVTFLSVVSWLVVVGGILWAAFSVFIGVQAGATGAGIGTFSAFTGLLSCLFTALALQVVAQLIRCLVRIEEHLDSISNNAEASAQRAA